MLLPSALGTGPGFREDQAELGIAAASRESPHASRASKCFPRVEMLRKVMTMAGERTDFRLAVPGKPFGLTLILRFFDRCGN